MGCVHSFTCKDNGIHTFTYPETLTLDNSISRPKAMPGQDSEGVRIKRDSRSETEWEKKRLTDRD